MKGTAALRGALPNLSPAAGRRTQPVARPSAQAADRAVHVDRVLGEGRIRLGAPAVEGLDAGVDEVEAVEEAGEFGGVAQLQGDAAGPVARHALRAPGRPEVGGPVAERQVAAGRQGVEQAPDHAVRVVAVGHEVQDGEDGQGHRLGQVEGAAHLAGAEDRVDVAQVGVEVGGAPGGVSGQQGAGVREDERVLGCRVVCTALGVVIGTGSEGGAVGKLGAGFVRVSTGSQDEISQIRILTEEAAAYGITIVKWFTLHGYSASHGAQEPALREVIADIERGDYTTLLVTESSRLDRREDLDAQAEILLSIRSAGGDIVSISEPQFGKADFAGRIVTLVAQHANAQKSRTVKTTTYRGMSMIIANGAHHGPLPAFWAIRGERYAKEAYCADPAAVKDIFERVVNRESLLSIARDYDLFPASIKSLVRFAANHSGIEECRYTYDGTTQTWAHTVEPVVDSPLWWRANNVLDANMTDARWNRGGRPVARPVAWISGILACPSCGGKLYYQGGLAKSGNPRTPKLRCGGHAKQRKACGIFTGCDALPVINIIETMFSSDTTPILAFQRVAGNGHELDEMRAEFARIQGRLSVTDDDDELDNLVAKRKALRVDIEHFTVIPDVYDYAETGHRVDQMWTTGDTETRQGMVRAVMRTWGLALFDHDGTWAITIGDAFADTNGAEEIVDLGNGLCFRRKSAA